MARTDLPHRHETAALRLANAARHGVAAYCPKAYYRHRRLIP
jgi:hypothetical protein